MNSLLILPAAQDKYTSQLPPSPSTSSNYSSSLGKNKAQDVSVQKHYGSLGTSASYLETLVSERPLTPSQTTIGQSDDDESLYLQWTHQLLRERGFTPSSCRPEDEEDDQIDYLNYKPLKVSSVDDSDDSSISDMSSDEEEDIDHYIAEQHKLLMASPSPSFVFYNGSRRPSIMSGYTTNNAVTDLERDEEPSSDTYSNRGTQNPITRLFRYCFSACL